MRAKPPHRRVFMQQRRGFARRGPAGGLMAGGAGARRPTRIAG